MDFQQFRQQNEERRQKAERRKRSPRARGNNSRAKGTSPRQTPGTPAYERRQAQLARKLSGKRRPRLAMRATSVTGTADERWRESSPGSE